MERSALTVIKATVTGILCLIILAGAWHGIGHSEPSLFKNGLRWGVLLVMLIVVFSSERFDRKNDDSSEPYVATGIVLVAMLALAVIGLM
jgi:hypothetical protein